ncbi:MAG: ATP-binding protein, partial [Bacillota bacterium]|nr:ATP-binding protein [Bacillota bacterium]
ARRDPLGVWFEVEDSGVGIDQQHLHRVFERFYRVDKARSTELGGTGLGLAIVKHIVEGHGGKVGVSSIVGRGTTFELLIPAQP